MKAMKKVWRYVRRNKKMLVLSIMCMLIVQVLGLVAPLIVKNILDEQLIQIEKPWYETESSQYEVSYNGKNYTQDVVSTEGISIVIYRTKYYVIDELLIEGSRSINGSTLTITTTDNQVFTYALVDTLSYDEVIDFYHPVIRPLTILIILLFARFFLQILFTYIQRIRTSMINVNIVRDGRKDAVKALQRMPMSYFDSEPAGKIANRIISDVNGMINLFSTMMNLLLNASLSIIFAYIGMFYLDWQLALLTFIVFPIVYLWLKVFIKRLNTIAETVNEQASMITANLNEIINGVNILQIFNYQKPTADKFNQLSNEFRNEKIKEQKLHLSIGWNLIRLLGALVTAVIILYFGSRSLSILGFVATAGLIYAYNDYLSRLIEPVGVLFRDIGNLQHAIVKTERLFKIIDSEQEDDAYTEIERFKGDIKFDDVWFSYKEGTPVLKGVSLDIKAGEMVGLVGHTGSGKSSLMSLLLRFYDLKAYDMGAIYVDGVDITSYPKRTFRTHIGIILQDPVIFKGTIADNVRFGHKEITDTEVERILRSIGGSKMIDKQRKGVLEPVTRGGGNLSVGEKQLISFARVIAHDPAILVMDEATSNIDTETETMIQEALNKVKENRTTIVIAHRLSTIKNADKIVVLESGLKVEEGTHQALMALNKKYALIYNAQIKDRF